MTGKAITLRCTCPVDAVVQLIGGKYKPVILWHLSQATHRFGELQRLVPQATGKMLTQQLRELEGCGLVRREVFPVVPLRTEYSLTDFGRTLVPILQAMCDWGNEYVDIEPPVPRAQKKSVRRP
ncbi:MAG: HTH hxlR-type domain-containing protein [Burkholderia sp.]|jgi:DNA-binding HxlR family transcriptional regulator